MKSFFLVVGLLFFGIASFGRNNCLRCERDSIRALIRVAKTDEQKLLLLKSLIDLRLVYELNDGDTLKKELAQYVSTGSQKKIKDIEAYREWNEGYTAFKRRDFVTALEKYKKAILLFDQHRAKITCLVSHVRNIYTELHQQEEKLKFYTQKIRQYQTDGPSENLAAAFHGMGNYYNFNAEYGLAISYYLKTGDLLKSTNESIMLWISLAAILIISASMSFVYRQYRTNKKTLQALQNTQQQLVLAEKMASLGELTAGIAHEIQNPLNFVNNFSEVNNELLDELKKELAVGNRQLAEEIADDIKGNSEKINHHGKRADAIVKSMLQHSRKSTGQKELVDINLMCDEYLRLAYHGLRAKDKTFNAKFETNLDSSVGKVSILSQDFGRVLLNLVNNSFYAVSERKNASANSGEVYEPEVIITTNKLTSDVFITVSDNGTGIKKEVVEKIFQPFYTTKPTGQGTGLGLSLSYDIIKAHGGEIKVETKEGEGTKFIIRIPA